MRSVLQLRTPQNGNGDQHQFGGVSVAVDSSPSQSSSTESTPKARFREPQIEMAHGAGGKASRRLIEGLFAPFFFGEFPGPLGDAAQLKINGARMAVTTDSFVVK